MNFNVVFVVVTKIERYLYHCICLFPEETKNMSIYFKILKKNDKILNNGETYLTVYIELHKLNEVNTEHKIMQYNVRTLYIRKPIKNEYSFYSKFICFYIL